MSCPATGVPRGAAAPARWRPRPASSSRTWRPAGAARWSASRRPAASTWSTSRTAAARAAGEAARAAASRTASGSRAVAGARARVASGSRIFVEGRHDAELVEKVWGDDLRIEGVVVELLEGVDDLAAVIRDFAPGPTRRMGVLVDHLVPGTKESRLVQEARALSRYAPYVRILGHPYVDVWQSVRPQRLAWDAWPVIARGPPWKHGITDALG